MRTECDSEPQRTRSVRETEKERGASVLFIHGLSEELLEFVFFFLCHAPLSLARRELLFSCSLGPCRVRRASGPPAGPPSPPCVPMSPQTSPHRSMHGRASKAALHSNLSLHYAVDSFVTGSLAEQRFGRNVESARNVVAATNYWRALEL